MAHGVPGRPAALADLIGDILEDYLAQEALHGRPAEEAGGSAPAIELF
jgi:hypothetical protein